MIVKHTITVEELLSFLLHVDGFKEIPVEDLEAFIVPLISITTYDAGQHIIAQGSVGESLFVLYEGLARIEVPLDDDDVLVFPLKPGEVVGEMSLVSNQPTRANVVAEKYSIVLALDVETFQSLMVNLWRVTKAFAGLIGGRMAARA